MSPGTIHWSGVCLDCADAEELARFYAELLGWTITARDSDESRLGGAGWIALTDPDGGVSLSIQAEEWYVPPTWPESHGAQSKMLHFELVTDDIDAAVTHVLAIGGRQANPQPPDRNPAQLRVMLDPAGHPFCLCTE